MPRSTGIMTAMDVIKRIKSAARLQVQKSRAGKRGLERMRAWQQRINGRHFSKISDASFNNFTYHGEDGILLYLLQHMRDVPPCFVDIGAGDCIKGNCTNLAIHFNWKGIFIDQNAASLNAGRSFYEKIRPEANLDFITSCVSPDNVNDLLGRAGTPTGLLSVDIDGNDYWIWKSISIIKPRIVVIEAKVEYGLRDVVVPYSSMNNRAHDIYYNGASVEALRKLGSEKGYNLVGANKQGYNLFFVQESEPIPAVTTEDLLNHNSIKKSFYPESFFAKHTFAR